MEGHTSAALVLTSVLYLATAATLARFGPGGIVTWPSPQLGQQLDQRLALACIERSKRLFGDCERVDGNFFCKLPARARQTHLQPTAVMRVGAGFDQSAQREPVDHALDGGDIHRRQPPEMVL